MVLNVTNYNWYLQEVLKGAENYARNGFPVHEVEAYSWKQKSLNYQNMKIQKIYF